MTRLWRLTVLFVFMTTCAEASYVTMAKVDLNGKEGEEIVRTESMGVKTSVRIYEEIEGSVFYKPAAEFMISGNLVQVPQIVDKSGDGIADFYFATGADVGIICFDEAESRYCRKNEVNADASGQVCENPEEMKKMMAEQKRESDLLLKMGRSDASIPSEELIGFEEEIVSQGKQVATL